VCAKKHEKDRFHWPKVGGTQGKMVLSQEEFAMLLGRIDLA
jgi:transposase